jgi:hypothetical protein
MSCEDTAPCPDLVTLLVGDIIRLTWELIALGNVLEERGIVSRADLDEAVKHAERAWSERVALEEMANPGVRFMGDALRARGWKPPAREGS